MSEKKIEPTDAMVDIVELADKLMATDTRGLLRYALNHPDARGLFADEDATDARPWESLGESDQVCVGDEVKWDYYGLTMTATVACVDKTGSLYTAAGLHIGVRSVGTWHVRRAAQELPTEDGSVIVPAEGREFIEQVGDCANYRRLTYDAASGRWIGWDTLNHEADALFPRHITPGTWKVQPMSAAPPECECPEAPERLWTTHYGAVDPGSMIEHNPECPVHRVDPQDSRLPAPWTRALNDPDTTQGDPK